MNELEAGRQVTQLRALTRIVFRSNVSTAFWKKPFMSIARRLLLTLLVLCLPLQSALALAGVPCRSMPATPSTAAMPMMAGHHDHAAMLAAQDKASHHHDKASKHPMGSCEHCAHCPSCSLSTGINAIFTQPTFHTVTPETSHVAEALVSLVLDTPQRPPQTA